MQAFARDDVELPPMPRTPQNPPRQRGIELVHVAGPMGRVNRPLAELRTLMRTNILHREKLEYDLFYIKNASFGLDVLILFKTLKILLLGRGGM